MGKPRCLFSYYGSKSKIAHKYPAPKYPLIIEPFAGGASYSLLHHEHDVLINEKDPGIYSIWEYLLNSSVETVLENIPKEVKKGDRIEDLLPEDADYGLVNLMRASCNMGTAGHDAVYSQVTHFAALHWHQVAKRIAYWLPKIKHWCIGNRDYLQLDTSEEATWFIDPPYDNFAGRRYRQKVLDYNQLGEWCRSLKGQVIVCENEGATWLPFRPLTQGISRGGVKRAVEVIWTNECP